MEIICLNGWGGRLHDALDAYLRAADPDVLCLQEVIHTPASDAEWLDYRDGDHSLPQRANFFRDVAAALPDHRATFCPAAEGELWQGDEAIPSQWGLATFVRGDIPVIGQVQGFVHKSFVAGGYGEHPRSRSAHAVRLHDASNPVPVTVAHMHGLRDLAGKMDTPERLRQAHRFADLVEATAEPGDRLVVCGDFNVEPQSETLGVLRGRLALYELVTRNGFAGTRSSFYKKPGRFADYMLVNESVTVEAFDVVETPEVSDHRPLRIVI